MSDQRDDDDALWAHIAKSVTPLHPAPPPRPEQHETHTPVSKNAPAIQPRPTPPPPAPKAPLPALTVEGPVAGLDKRTARRLAQGQAAPTRTLDLHGYTLSQAFATLKQFIPQSRMAGHRTVLVITGKGRQDHGTIRAEFAHWINDPTLRPHIITARPAHARHGGHGAFYVRLRKMQGG